MMQCYLLYKLSPCVLQLMIRRAKFMLCNKFLLKYYNKYYKRLHYTNSRYLCFWQTFIEINKSCSAK